MTVKKQAELEQFISDAIERRRLVDLSRIAESDELPKDFKRTKTFDQIVEAIRLGRRIEASLVLIHGVNGGGKTTALKAIAAVAPDTHYWEVPSGLQPKHLLRDILAQLPVQTGEGWRLQTSVAIDYLSGNPQTFLLDEAQRLDYSSLDLLKYLADNSGSMFVLAASPSLARRIEKWPDIASRCPVRLRIEPISLEEFVELYQAEGWSLEVLREIHRISGGVMRVARSLFLVLDDYLTEAREAGQRDITRAVFRPHHVAVIAKGVVPTAVDGELARRA